MTYRKPVIAITMGDPAGSGPEIGIKAITKDDLRDKAKIVLVGDLNIFKRASEAVNATSLKFVKINKPSEAVEQANTINILDLDNVDSSKLAYGTPSSLGGKASYECIVRAVDYALSGEINALVTAPISKESLKLAGYNYPGHTELLAHLTGARDVRMMLIAGEFRVVHVCTHVSLRKSIELVEKERIVRTAALTHESLVDLFGIQRPAIAMSGLNPHAGESGLFGDEETKQIAPAVKELRGRGMNVTGPYPPDSVFYRAYHNKQFDAVIAMYHDQGHIAMKMVGFMEGVNLSLGLPIIRASPDHGTVWGKAGKGTADERSLSEAIKMAVALASRRAHTKKKESAP